MRKFFMAVEEYAKRNVGNGKRGYVSLLGVLIVGAVALSLTISLLLLGISFSRSSLAMEQSAQARAFAYACVEEALQRIHDSTPFTGSDTLSFTHGTCDYTVTSQGGQNRIITGTGFAGEAVRKIHITLDTINPSIGIVSWQEVGDF